MNTYNSRKRRGLKTKALIRKSSRARLVVYRSSTHIYSQIIETDTLGDKVIASCSTNDKDLRSGMAGKCKVDQANMIGKELAKRASEKGVTSVAFDRNGYKYHGRVKALADGAREAGLDF